MRSLIAALVVATGLAAAIGEVESIAQAPPNDVDEHVAAARAAGAKDHPGLFNSLCSPNSIRPAPTPQRGQGARGNGGAPPATPDAATWHAEPVKVFDNLYYVGMTEYSAWAVSTSGGLILLDTIFDYSIEDEVVGGLKKLGLDPATIKYALVSHGHLDHFGGAKYLQDHFNTRVIMSAADWELIAQSNTRGDKPRRDMVATDGQKLTLGDTTLTFYLTPGHTPGTVSTLIPVKDGGKNHVVAEWGGTGFNFTLSPDKPRLFWFETYSKSAEHFRDAAMKAGADVLISNHTSVDGSKSKLPAMANRKAGDAHPYVIGSDSVQRFLTVAAECAKAGAASLSQSEK